MKTYLFILTGFIGFTIIGTITHELGHFFAGKSIGLNCKIHYSSCSCISDLDLEQIHFGNELFEKYRVRDSIPKELWDKYLQLKSTASETNHVWVTVGGPLQTMTIGLIGFVALVYRKMKRKNNFNLFDWLLVFISLFWLRQPFNLITSFYGKVNLNKSSFFGGDEFQLSKELGIWDGAISVSSAAIGLIITSVVIFKIIPNHLQLKFITCGLVGSAMGYIIWMKLLGPIVLP